MRAHGGHRDHPGPRQAAAAPCASPRQGAEGHRLRLGRPRREADEWSDLDLVIIAETPRPFFERYRDFAGIYSVWPRLDLLVYTPEEFERMRAEGRPFIEQILTEGVVVHEAEADR